MSQLPEALAPLAAFHQFIIYKLVASSRPGKTDKFPCDMSGAVRDAHDSAIWLTLPDAQAVADAYGPEYGVGFVFTADDPFYFFDIDDCLMPDGATWSPIANQLIARFPGAAIEISQSGRGLHIIGTGTPTTPSASRRQKAKDPTTGKSDNLFDLYTERRFVALTGTGAMGSVSTVADQAQLDYIVGYYLQKTGAAVSDWTTAPVENWTGPEDDDDLIRRALASKSAEAAFGDRCSFRDLWESNEPQLLKAFPDDHGGDVYDESRADAALAQHLAFWTGNNCERIRELMQRSALVREKWERDDYLPRTILNATSMQTTVYSTAPAAEVDHSIADQFGAIKLRASSDKQREYAETIRSQKLAECGGDEELIHKFCRVPAAKFWLDNKGLTVDQLASKLTAVAKAAEVFPDELERAAGYQFLNADRQVEHFAGCVYVQLIDKVFTPSGTLLKSSQFNATYGGYVFQLDDLGEKTTRKAYEAFTESQVVRYPKAEVVCFRPALPPGALVREEGRTLVNTYVPITTPRIEGDASPFLVHLAKVLPDAHDQTILLSYMAACVQYKGVKFQWAPLLQGVEGNGKTLFTRCVAFAIGRKYTHMPPALDLAEKFNAWLFDKLLIGIEDIYVPEHKREIIEVLKPMITNDGLSKRGMQQDQIMQDVTANFMLNSNHRNAVRKTRNDRRFCVFYTAQQIESDLARDGMDGEYFPKLYAWLKGTDEHSEHGAGYGYAVVNDFLNTYQIPAELNPATFAAHRAPITSTTDEAIAESLGSIEQEILEAIDEDRPGFAGGWVSSVALDKMLFSLHAARAIPPNKRREMLQSMGYDWHPALKDGRTAAAVPLDDGKKPKLFIRQGHIHANLATSGEIVRAYVDAQGAVGSLGTVADKFAK